MSICFALVGFIVPICYQENLIFIILVWTVGGLKVKIWPADIYFREDKNFYY